MKHTLGPWILRDAGHVYAGASRQAPCIATVHKEVDGCHGMPRSERDANARLIAAAPELLRALIDIRDSSAYDIAAKSRATGALEKLDATVGISECDEVARSLAPKFPAFRNYSEALANVRREMPDESETVINNVAWSLWTNQ